MILLQRLIRLLTEMNRTLLLFCLAWLLPLCCLRAQREEESLAVSRSDNGYRNKTGFFFSYADRQSHFNTLSSQPGYYGNLEGCQGFSVGLWRNIRLVTGLYWQPEMAYYIYNGEGSCRNTLVSFTPLQIQLGVHMGLVRPFIAGGVSLDYFVGARKSDGSSYTLPGWTDKERCSWDYFISGGIDVLSFLQISLKFRHWMFDLDHYRPDNWREMSLGAAMFF